MRIWHSLSFRLALTYVALLCLSLVTLLGLYYGVSAYAPLETVKADVAEESADMAHIYRTQGVEALARTLDARAARLDVRKPFHVLIDRKGEVQTANLPSWPVYKEPTWLRIEADIYRDGDESDHEALVWDQSFDDGARLMLGRDIEDIDEVEEQLQVATTWLLPSALILGIFGGALMSRTISKRLEAINSAARIVIAGDLSGRVALRGSGDDFDRLGETLNVMLSRIEELLDAIRRVSDSVAHELRTPLARLLVSLEEMAEPDAEYREALLKEATAEARRLQRVFDALLRIARIESGRHEDQPQPVALAQLVDDAVEFYQPDAESKAIALRAVSDEAAITLQGDPHLLFQALVNLIDNALKYTPRDGEVTVGVQRQGAEAVLYVSDTGMGISTADRERLTERFYRAAVAQGVPGEGLGLSLVAAVTARHGGSLHFLDRDGGQGTRVELRFPLYPPAQRPGG